MRTAGTSTGKFLTLSNHHHFPTIVTNHLVYSLFFCPLHTVLPCYFVLQYFILLSFPFEVTLLLSSFNFNEQVDEWKHTLKEGDCIDIYWAQNGRWYHSKVLSKDKDIIRVHYNGWSTTFDERIDVTNPSRFIYPERTFTEKRSKKTAPASHLPMSKPNGLTEVHSRKKSSTSAKPDSGGSARTDKMEITHDKTEGNSAKIKRVRRNDNFEERFENGTRVVRVQWESVIDAYKREFDEHFSERMELHFANGHKVCPGNKKGWFLVSLLDSILQSQGRRGYKSSKLKFCGPRVLTQVILFVFAQGRTLYTFYLCIHFRLYHNRNLFES